MNPIYIPFHDGLLDHDCQECGGACCQSGNIVANEQETRILLQEHPQIRFFRVRDHEKMTLFRKHPPCWFLNQDGACEIQREHGYALKPLVCRLHPFYVARCGDEYVVVTSGCDPLHVTERGRRSHVSHQAVLTNAQEAVDSGWTNENIDWPQGRLDLERAVLDESARLLDRSDYLDFAAFQVVVAAREEDRAAVRARLAERLELWQSYLGIEDLAIENLALTYELTALTPLLRVSHARLRKMAPSRIPEAMTVLYLYMLLFSAGRNLKKTVATYQSVLSDLPLGLVYLTAADLRLRSQPLEKRLLYLQWLWKIHVPGFLEKAKARSQETESTHIERAAGE